MNFSLTDAQRRLRDTMRDFAAEHVAPHAAEWDRSGQFPLETVRQLGQLGLLGVVTAREYGGLGAGNVALALVVEEVARHDGSLALTVASHNGLGQTHLNVAGTDAQKRRWLPDIAAGRKLAGWGLTEPGSGSDAGAAATRAIRRGDGWTLSGSKLFITQGTVGDFFVILASTSPEKKQKGLTAFVVERGMRGFTAAGMHGKLGMRSSDTAELHLDGVELPDAHRLGDVDAGFRDTLQVLDRGRITIGALSVGLARGALEDATALLRGAGALTDSARERLAELGCEVEAARGLVLQSAWLAQEGRPFRREASMGKLFASEVAMRACATAAELAGTAGITRAHGLDRALRDAKLCTIGEGTSEVQRLVIARAVLGGA